MIGSAIDFEVRKLIWSHHLKRVPAFDSALHDWNIFKAIAPREKLKIPVMSTERWNERQNRSYALPPFLYSFSLPPWQQRIRGWVANSPIVDWTF